MSVRLSPAANLLRNSKLFALPPAIALPIKPPSSNEISESDTATTPYPQFAAIQTTYTCGQVGDWGLKRPLPLKTVKNTKNPVVRLLRGIDTREHIADFESAADHVLTLRKFEELDHPIKLASNENSIGGNRQNKLELNHRVFRALSDNTTNLSSTAPYRKGDVGLWASGNHEEDVVEKLPPKLRQKQIEFDEMNILPKQDKSTAGELFQSAVARGTGPVTRWRYRGPSLTQISGMEFEEYLKGLGKKEIVQLHDRVREAIVSDKQTQSRDAGNVEESFKKEDVTDREVQDRIRTLRREPAKFGPMIAKILDLPYVAPLKEHASQRDWWEYGPSTLASPQWSQSGTPKTHPSAGLSYATGTNVVNDPTYRPQMVNNPVVARAVRKRAKAVNSATTWGVAGFIADGNDNIDRNSSNGTPFEKKPGGMKTAVQPRLAYITPEGLLNLRIYEHENFVVRDDKAITRVEDAALNAAERAAAADSAKATVGDTVSRMPQLSGSRTNGGSAPSRYVQNKETAALDDRLDQILGGRR